MQAAQHPQAHQESYPEKLLHYAWQHRRYDFSALHTADNQPVTVIKPGILNGNAGPDFLNATVKIGKLEFHGHVEMHVTGADWYAHGHERDPDYNNVVLHVVGKGSELPPRRQDGTYIPELVLGERLDADLLQNFGRIVANEFAIPCAAFFPRVPLVIQQSWIQSLGAARMLERSAYIKATWEASKHDWQQAFWQVMLGAMGGPVNRQAFEELAIRVPYSTVAAQRKDLQALEAMLFYGARLLEVSVEDAYAAELAAHAAHYQRVYKIEALPKGMVRFGRMRPQGFPTLRLAQVAAMVHKRADWLNLLSAGNKELSAWLTSPTSTYWATHYRFGKESAKHGTSQGEDQVKHILINTILPFAVFYHNSRGSDVGVEAALERLGELKAESNTIIRQYRQLGYKAASALETQGLLHLNRNYCLQKNCLSCGIGHHIFKRDAT